MRAVMRARSHAPLHSHTPCPYVFLAVAPPSAATKMLSSVARDVMAMSTFNRHSDGDAMPFRQHLTPAFPRSVGLLSAAHKRWRRRTGGRARAGDRRQTDVYSHEQAGAVPAQPRVKLVVVGLFGVRARVRFGVGLVLTPVVYQLSG